MINYYKLKDAIMWLYDYIRNEDYFEQICDMLGEAIDVDGYKLQLLVYHEVDEVFADRQSLAIHRSSGHKCSLKNK